MRHQASAGISSPDLSDLVLDPGYRDEVVERLEVVDVELALEVVELVLHGARQQARAHRLDALAVAVLGFDPDLLLALHVGHVAGHGEAALEVVALARGADDDGVDQLVELALDLDDTDLQGLADLRCRQAHAGRVAHRVREVVEQLVQVLAEAVDRLAHEAQPRVTEGQDGLDGHGARSIGRALSR